MVLFSDMKEPGRSDSTNTYWSMWLGFSFSFVRHDSFVDFLSAAYPIPIISSAPTSAGVRFGSCGRRSNHCPVIVPVDHTIDLRPHVDAEKALTRLQTDLCGRFPF